METIWVFFLGLAVGSFANELIDRLPQGRSVIWGRSVCDDCRKTLRWYELVPVFSWLIQVGRCRRCRARLSVKYPLIELIFGVIFVVLAGRMGLVAGLVPGLVLATALMVIFVTDLKYQIIPDSMVLLALAAVIVLKFFTHSPTLLSSLGAAAGVGGFFFALWFFTRGRGMGFGDVKLAPVLAFWLGWPLSLAGLYVAFLTGAVVGVILILGANKHLKTRIAFGPFLVLGAVISIWQQAWFISFWKNFL